MGIAKLTASAWATDPVVGGPKPLQPKPLLFWWTIRAKVSVSDAGGHPINGLNKSAWKVHVTDASGTTLPGAFTVSPVQAPPQAGFYLLKLSPLPADVWVAFAACGISVESKKLDAYGQVVVPIQLMGKHAVQELAPPSN